jgi:hypothetical protein
MRSRRRPLHDGGAASRAVPGPHQVAAGILTRADQITRGLLFGPGHPDRGDLSQHEQPREPVGVAPVGLDSVGCRPHLRRCSDNAAHPRLGTRACKPVPGRSCLVHDSDRRRQRLQPRDGRDTPGRHPKRPHLTAPHIDHARDHRPSVHIKSDPATFRHPAPPRNCGSTAAPTATATRANLRSEAPGTPYGLGQPSGHAPGASRTQRWDYRGLIA